MTELTEGRKNNTMLLAILPSFVGLIGVDYIYVGRIGLGICFMFVGFIGLVATFAVPWLAIGIVV